VRVARVVRQLHDLQLLGRQRAQRLPHLAGGREERVAVLDRTGQEREPEAAAGEVLLSQLLTGEDGGTAAQQAPEGGSEPDGERLSPGGLYDSEWDGYERLAEPFMP
jgi:hypothetical protein